MARYKPYDVNQVTLIPVSFPDQILPGSFEYALNEIVERELANAVRDARKAGASWAKIGHELGTSGEAARQRYNDRVA